MASSLIEVINKDDTIASETSRVLYEYVRHGKSVNVLVCSFR